MTKPIHHEHVSHSYERMGRAETWVGWAAAALAILAVVAVAGGLLTTTGHVTW